ncbi:MAG TPA: hypothetical protein VIJ59_04555 [Caulobacteraceae bacterium]
MKCFQSWRWLVVVGLNALSWAGQAPAAPAMPVIQVGRIGIIASLGDHIEFTRVGFTVFDTKTEDLPITGWGLDDLVVRDATALLSPKFQISPVLYDKSSFLPADMKWPNPRNPKLEPLIRALPHEDVDAYLVVRRTAFAFAEQYNEGLSATKWKPKILTSPSQVCATFEVDLVQAGSGTILSSGVSPFTCTHFAHDDLADSPDKMTSAQTQALHQRVEALILRELSRSLSKMGLITPNV